MSTASPKWDPLDDTALHDAVSETENLTDAAKRLSVVLGRTVTRFAVRRRLERIGWPRARKPANDDIPIYWEPDPFRPDAGPGPSSALRRILLIPDSHVPFHSKLAWELMLRAARVAKPDVLIVLGDLADFYAVSFHSKNPSRRHLLKDELEEVNIALDQLDALGAPEKHFVAGNHEHRLERYIHEKAPELDGLVDLRELLRIQERGWKWTPYKDALKIGHLHVTHDEGTAGIYAHYRARATFETNVVIGHTHRMGLHYQGNAQGVSHVGAMLGWLGDIDAIDYVHKAKARQWQHGFGLAVMEPNGNVHLQACPIIDGRVCVFGELVS